MKKYFLMLTLCLSFGMAVTSCDDDEPKVTKVEVVDKGNQLSLNFTTVLDGIKVDSEWLATFDRNELCETFVITYKCSSSANAETLRKVLQEKNKDGELFVTRGNSVVQDCTEQMKGLPKSVVRVFFDEAAKELK